jgi:hypothetical protein
MDAISFILIIIGFVTIVAIFYFLFSYKPSDATIKRSSGTQVAVEGANEQNPQPVKPSTEKASYKGALKAKESTGRGKVAERIVANKDVTLYPSLPQTTNQNNHFTHNDFCECIQVAPPGVRPHKWVLRDDNNSHHHGVVNINKVPYYLDLSWRKTAKDQKKQVGLFKLNLPNLLQGDFIRHDPKDSFGPNVRLRIVRTNDGKFFIQVNHDGPRILLA